MLPANSAPAADWVEAFTRVWPVKDAAAAPEIATCALQQAKRFCSTESRGSEEEKAAACALRALSSAMQLSGLHEAFGAPEPLEFLIAQALHPSKAQVHAIKCVHNACVMSPDAISRLVGGGYPERLVSAMQGARDSGAVAMAANSLTGLACRYGEFKHALLETEMLIPVVTEVLAWLALSADTARTRYTGAGATAATSCLQLLFALGDSVIGRWEMSSGGGAAAARPKGAAAAAASCGPRGGSAASARDLDRLGMVLMAVVRGSPAGLPPASIPGAIELRAEAAQVLMHAPTSLGNALAATGCADALVELAAGACDAYNHARSEVAGAGVGRAVDAAAAASGLGGRAGTDTAPRAAADAARREAAARRDAMARRSWAVLLLVQRYAGASEAFRAAAARALLPPADAAPAGGAKPGAAPVKGGALWTSVIGGVQRGTDRMQRAGLEAVLALAGGSTATLTKLVGVGLAFPLLHAHGAVSVG